VACAATYNACNICVLAVARRIWPSVDTVSDPAGCSSRRRRACTKFDAICSHASSLGPRPGQCSRGEAAVNGPAHRCQDGDRISTGRDRRVRKKGGPQLGRGFGSAAAIRAPFPAPGQRTCRAVPRAPTRRCRRGVQRPYGPHPPTPVFASHTRSAALDADGQVTRICRDPLASAMVARVSGSPLLWPEPWQPGRPGGPTIWMELSRTSWPA
jgi:hypothetical protein